MIADVLTLYGNPRELILLMDCNVPFIYVVLFVMYTALNPGTFVIFQLAICAPVYCVTEPTDVVGSENWPFLRILLVWKVRILAFADISESMLYRA